MLLALIAVFLTAFIVTLIVSPSIIKKEIEAGIIGNDMHKDSNEKVANMGGLSVAIGVAVAVILAIGFKTFFHTAIDLTIIMAGLITILLINLMGIFDDLFEIKQLVKALLPLFAAIPLIAISVGNTVMSIPFIGTINFGIIYLIALVPLGVAVASNLTNMLAGFNGNEVGMGIVIFLTSAYICLKTGENEALFISIAMLGALIGFLRFNWYPSKAFPGDVLNLMIGGTLAVVVIIGDFESIGFILMIPYVIDWIIKAKNKFPKSFAVYNSTDGKLYAPTGKTRGLADLILRISGGMKEIHLTLTLIGIEIVFALIALLIYTR